VIAALARIWPRTFFVDPERRLPLKVGIGDELKEVMVPAIRAGRISTHDINIAIRRYVDSRGYLENCSFNAPRVGLNGSPAGRVSYRQSLYAQERLRVGRF
jgi:sRNA-binding protein